MYNHEYLHHTHDLTLPQKKYTYHFDEKIFDFGDKRHRREYFSGVRQEYFGGVPIKACKIRS